MSKQAQSFGTYLKQYRNRRTLSQEDLAQELNFSKITISRWERNIQIPPAPVIPEISKVLKLSYLEEHALFATAKYVLSTKMPRLQQIKDGLRPYIDDIASDIFPSVIVDYHFTQWVQSPSSISVFGEDKMKENWRQSPSHFFPVFSSDIAPKISEDTTINQTIQVKLFFVMNMLRRHEAWFINYPDFIENTLSVNDHLAFKYVWQGVLSELHSGNGNIYSDILGIIRGKPTFGQTEVIDFKQRIETIADLPQFAIMRFLPVNKASANRWFEMKQDIEVQSPITLWDVYDDNELHDLLAMYL